MDSKVITPALKGDFYVELSSQPTEHFPGNTTYKFDNHLGEIVHVGTDEEWEVAVTHFSFPFAWNTLDSNNLPEIKLAYGRDKDDRDRSKRGTTQAITIPQGTYTTVDEIINTLISQISFARSCVTRDALSSRPDYMDIGFMFKMRELPGASKVHIGMAYNALEDIQFRNECLWIKYNQAFSNLYGLPSGAFTTRYYSLCADTEVTGINTVSFHRDVTAIAVLSNLVEQEWGCLGKKAPTLFTTTTVVKPKYGHIMQTIVPKVMSYKRCTAQRLDQMRFEVVDQEGKHIDFAESLSGKVKEHKSNIHLGLHFRRQT